MMDLFSFQPRGQGDFREEETRADTPTGNRFVQGGKEMKQGATSNILFMTWVTEQQCNQSRVLVYRTARSHISRTIAGIRRKKNSPSEKLGEMPNQM
jgi:hypothetical protein